MINNDRLLIFQFINDELIRAVKLHTEWPDDMFRQLAIMNEESGEVTRAVLHYYYENGRLEDVKTELIQTAAMCVRMLEYLTSRSIPDTLSP